MVKINRLCFMCGYRCCVCESLLVFTDLLALHYLQTIILLLGRQNLGERGRGRVHIHMLASYCS